MADLIETLLTDRGPMSSSELADLLVKEHKLSPPNARQRISRHPRLKRLAYLPLPRNARFVYLQSQFGSPWFWEALAVALADTAYGATINALSARDGIVPLRHFDIVCGSPAAQKRHLSPTKILERLERAKLIRVQDVAGVGPCATLIEQHDVPKYQASAIQGRLVAEAILLKAIRMWMKNLGLASFNLIKLRDEGDEQPRVGTFRWDLSGPSYVVPMVEYQSDKPPKPGFVVCDVLLGKELTVPDLRPFLLKCRTLRGLKGVGRCMQMFVADGFDRDGLRAARQTGVIAATPENLFGDEVGAALLELTNLLSTAAQQAADPEKLDLLFRRLGKIEGAAINLRGALFEYVVADLVKETSNCIDVELNEIFSVDGAKAEVDVFAALRQKSVRVIEARGYQPQATIPDEMVRKWLEERVPFIRKALLANPEWRDQEMVFEFWTTGRVSDEARALVRKAQETIGKYKVALFEADSILELARSSRKPRLQEVLEVHFFEHPLATIDREVERAQQRAMRRARRATLSDFDPFAIENTVGDE